MFSHEVSKTKTKISLDSIYDSYNQAERFNIYVKCLLILARAATLNRQCRYPIAVARAASYTNGIRDCSILISGKTAIKSAVELSAHESPLDVAWKLICEVEDQLDTFLDAYALHIGTKFNINECAVVGDDLPEDF